MWVGYIFCSRNMVETMSFKNKILKSSIINGFAKKKHGIDQNQAQKAFMISNLHKSAYLKK